MGADQCVSEGQKEVRQDAILSLKKKMPSMHFSHWNKHFAVETGLGRLLGR